MLMKLPELSLFLVGLIPDRGGDLCDIVRCHNLYQRVGTPGKMELEEAIDSLVKTGFVSVKDNGDLHYTERWKSRIPEYEIMCDAIFDLLGDKDWKIVNEHGFKFKDGQYEDITRKIDESGVEYIERELDISLPNEFSSIFDSFPHQSYIGSTEQEFWHDAEEIVLWTKKYRSGYNGLPAWPDNYLCIGDDGAACPYVLDLNSGLVLHLDHGHINTDHLGTDEQFENWISWFISELKLRESERKNTGCFGVALSLIAIPSLLGILFLLYA